MRILIADDSDIVRRGVSLVLSGEAGWDVCGEACDGDEAVAKVKGLNPDVVVIDMRMPGKNGLEVAGLIHQEFPNIIVIIMSQYDRNALLPRALEAGASACVDKSKLAPCLVDTIRQVMHG
ncbi:MAG TPA: response regulator transcription factor [Candidatus Acidoferrum sp.]